MTDLPLYVFNGFEAAFIGVAAWFSSLVVGHSPGGLIAFALAVSTLVSIRLFAAAQKSPDPEAAMVRIPMEMLKRAGIIMAFCIPVTTHLSWLGSVSDNPRIDMQAKLEETEVGRGLLRLAGYNVQGSTISNPAFNDTSKLSMRQKALRPLIKNEGIVMPAAMYAGFTFVSVFTYKLLDMIGWTQSFTTENLPNMLAGNQFSAMQTGNKLKEAIGKTPQVLKLATALDSILPKHIHAALKFKVGEVMAQHQMVDVNYKLYDVLTPVLNTGWTGNYSFMDFVSCRPTQLYIPGITTDCMGLDATLNGKKYTDFKQSHFNDMGDALRYSTGSFSSDKVLHGYSLVADHVTNQDITDNIVSNRSFDNIQFRAKNSIGLGIRNVQDWLVQSWKFYAKAYKTDYRNDPTKIDPSTDSPTRDMIGRLALVGAYYIYVGRNLDPDYQGKNIPIDLGIEPSIKGYITQKVGSKVRHIINQDVPLVHVGYLLNKFAKGLPVLPVLHTRAQELVDFGQSYIDAANGLYDAALSEAKALDDAGGTTTKGGSTFGMIGAFFTGKAVIMGLVLQVLSVISWAILTLMFVSLVIKTAAEFLFWPFAVAQCAFEASENPLKALFVRALATRLFALLFIVGGMMGYFGAAFVSGVGWVTDSIMAQILGLWLQILVVGIITYKSTSMLFYRSSDIIQAIGGSGGGGGAGGGGGSNAAEKSAERMAGPVTMTASTAAGTALAGAATAGVGGAAIAAAQHIGKGVKASQAASKVAGAAQSVGSAAMPGGGSAMSRSGGGGVAMPGGGGRGKQGGGAGLVDIPGGDTGGGGNNRRQKGSRGGSSGGKGADAGNAAMGGQGGGIPDFTGGRDTLLGAMAHGAQMGFKQPGLPWLSAATKANNAIDNAVGSMKAKAGGGMAAGALGVMGGVLKGGISAYSHAQAMSGHMNKLLKSPLQHTDDWHKAMDKKNDEDSTKDNGQRRTAHDAKPRDRDKEQGEL